MKFFARAPNSLSTFTRLTLAQTGAVVALWMALLMLPLAPLNTRFSGAGVLLFLAVSFGTRNIFAIGGTAAALNLTARFLIQISSWHDQHWVQWSSISSVLTGHNIFSTSPLYNFSLSSYMPAGDLFGGLFIALGIHRYWLVWHVLVVCLTALPLLLSPSFATLIVFIATSSFYPFCDYTTGGGTVEIAYALMIGAIAMFRSQRLLTASLALFAFCIMFRQPAAAMAPFLLLILWRMRDGRRAIFFGVLLVLFGGIYIVTYPQGAYHYLYQVWDGYHQELFNFTPGLQANYSISAIPHALGVPDSVTWYGWKALYLPITIAGLATLLAIAWFRNSREEILLLGVLASAGVYVLSRGYAQFSYVCTAFFPLVAFVYPVTGSTPRIGKQFAHVVAILLVWVGATPAFLFMGAWTLRKLDDLRPVRAVHASEIYEVRPNSPVASLPAMDGVDANRFAFSLPVTVQFQLPGPQFVSGIRLSCDHISILELKGVPMPYPTDTQMRGAITEGVIEASDDGLAFTEIRHFHNSATYCIWPVTISLPATPRPLLALRLRPMALYLDQKEGVLGNIEFLERR